VNDGAREMIFIKNRSEFIDRKNCPTSQKPRYKIEDLMIK
jgi:hypothetical protein